ncbi:MAG: hypothetical protein ACOZAQ_10865 [Pseudomonadota bacterium]
MAGALALSVSMGLGAADVYRLEGGSLYTDRLPPDRVKEGYTVLDKDGREIRRMPPALTPEELEAEKRRVLERREQQRLDQQQQQRDSALLKLYASEEAIVTARDSRLGGLDSQRAVMVSQMSTVRQRLELLERQDPSSAEIPVLRQRLAANEETVRLLLKERQSENERYNADLERWRYLKQTGKQTGAMPTTRPVER